MRSKYLISGIVTFGIVLGAMLPSVLVAKFPKKPITIMVYVKPGGGIDRDSRKLAIIGERLTGHKFVVKNKPGAGGIVAMKYILSQPADGYTLFGTTKSPVYKTVSAKSDINLGDFEWLAMSMSDPEAIITHREQAVNTWEQVVADAKALEKQGKRQIWVGPAAGGLDHVMAMKTWKAAGIKAKYIPFKGGKKAMIELLGKRGVVYVGNAQDILGQPKLKVAALSRSTRLSQFPDAPTFKELGVKGMDNEIMWRGFAIKKGIPADVREFYDDLFTKLMKDSEWIEYVSKKGVDPVYYNHEKFYKIVMNDKADVTRWLKSAGILK